MDMSLGKLPSPQVVPPSGSTAADWESGVPAPAHDLGVLYDAHASSLLAFALSLTRSSADARDVLQDVFTRLAHHPRRLDDVRDARGFLLRLTHHAAIDLFRRQQRQLRQTEPLGEAPPSAFASATDPDEQAFREALAGALAELPPDQRAVVHLKLWEGLTFEQIASLLDIPPNTAASRYRYGLEKLRSRLRPLYTEIQ